MVSGERGGHSFWFKERDFCVAFEGASAGIRLEQLSGHKATGSGGPWIFWEWDTWGVLIWFLGYKPNRWYKLCPHLPYEISSNIYTFKRHKIFARLIFFLHCLEEICYRIEIPFWNACIFMVIMKEKVAVKLIHLSESSSVPAPHSLSACLPHPSRSWSFSLWRNWLEQLPTQATTGDGGEAPDRSEVKSNREALPHFSLSQVGSQNAACQAYIYQPGTRQKANILNFGESSQGTAGLFSSANPQLSSPPPQLSNHIPSCQTTAINLGCHLPRIKGKVKITRKTFNTESKHQNKQEKKRS